MFFFFKQKTSYEMRISDWSSDVCSSDLLVAGVDRLPPRRVGRRCHRRRLAEGPHAAARPLVQCGKRQGAAGIEDGGAAALLLVMGRDGGAQRERRAEERRVGKGCVRTCRFRWSP